MKKIQLRKRMTLDAWVFSLLILVPVSGKSFEYQAFEKKIKTDYSVRSVVEKMSRRDIEGNLRDFVASGRPARLMGSPGHEKAQVYLENKLKTFTSANSFFTKEEFLPEFSNDDALKYPTIAKEKGVNLVWEKKGVARPDEVIILGANYDTLLKDPKTNTPILKGEMPGADNNASGVAVLLSMIEILDKLELPKTVKIVFFDFEEFNSFGSKEFAKKMIQGIGTQKIVGVINLTMIAHDTRGSDLEKKMNNFKFYTRPKTTSGQELDLNFGKLITANGKRISGSIEFKDSDIGTLANASNFPDTAQSFWGLGLPAITMTENRESDLNPRYMTSNDFVETLNLNTYINVFKYVSSAVLAWNYDVVK